eukprot:scaffold129433_cov59-Attheya_sp.AAC.1
MKGQEDKLNKEKKRKTLEAAGKRNAEILWAALSSVLQNFMFHICHQLRGVWGEVVPAMDQINFKEWPNMLNNVDGEIMGFGLGWWIRADQPKMKGSTSIKIHPMARTAMQKSVIQWDAKMKYFAGSPFSLGISSSSKPDNQYSTDVFDRIL